MVSLLELSIQLIDTELLVYDVNCRFDGAAGVGSTTLPDALKLKEVWVGSLSVKLNVPLFDPTLVVVILPTNVVLPPEVMDVEPNPVKIVKSPVAVEAVQASAFHRRWV